MVSSPHPLSAPSASLRPHPEAGLGTTGEKTVRGVGFWLGVRAPVSNSILTCDLGPVTCLLGDSSLKAVAGGEGRGGEGPGRGWLLTRECSLRGGAHRLYWGRIVATAEALMPERGRRGSRWEYKQAAPRGSPELQGEVKQRQKGWAICQGLASRLSRSQQRASRNSSMSRNRPLSFEFGWTIAHITVKPPDEESYSSCFHLPASEGGACPPSSADH